MNKLSNTYCIAELSASITENSGRGHLSLFPCIWGLRKMGLNQQKTPSLIICPPRDIWGHSFEKIFYFFKTVVCYLVALMLTVELWAEFALEFDAQTALTL